MKADFNPSYVGPRNDIVKLVTAVIKKVLDIGYSSGVLGESIKYQNLFFKLLHFQYSLGALAISALSIFRKDN